ncbi:unnamed protein product [Gongylonema pulchrum]|uniref:Dihydrolipoamide acetyltransferase component of pyruvate dehydrogenase complex n=1 Tax=Gongylonema pulchrum TaxID=637853 RepID=A0A183CVV4_9BILA|nr:unnamed protein product [Gongylonema pulchrum]
MAVAATATAGGTYPEHVELPFPALSPTMDTGKVVAWHKQVGDEIAEGDLLCDIETDKSVMAFETTEEGFLAKIILPEGTAGVPPLCVICKNQQDVSAFANYTPETAGAATAAVTAAPSPVAVAPPPVPAPSISSVASVPSPAEDPAASRPPGARVIATPYARKLAAEMGVDLSEVVGTGPGGRIVAADLEGAEPSEEVTEEPSAGPKKPRKKASPKRAVPGDPKYKDIPLSNMRETIAKRLSKSKNEIPHYYLTSEVYVDELLKLRKKLNEDLKGQGIKVSVNDFIVKACALACLDVPEANSYFLEKEKVIRQNLTVDIAVAVKTKTGLLTPIVFNADSKVRL